MVFLVFESEQWGMIVCFFLIALSRGPLFLLFCVYVYVVCLIKCVLCHCTGKNELWAY